MTASKLPSSSVPKSHGGRRINDRATIPLRESDQVPIAEIAEALNIPASALLLALEKSRQITKKPFYSISELAVRWKCSRATVYNVLRESELKLLNLSSKQNRGRWSIPASVVERIEQSRMERIPEVAA